MLILLSLIALYGTSLSLQAEQETRPYLIIDIRKAIFNSPKAQIARNQLKSSLEAAGTKSDAMRKEYRDLLDQMQETFDQLEETEARENNPAFEKKEALEKKEEALEKIEAIKRELIETEQKIHQYKRYTRRNLAKSERSLFQPIVAEVREVIDTVAKEKKADLVFDISKDALIYFDEGKTEDITETVIKRLNEPEPPADE